MKAPAALITTAMLLSQLTACSRVVQDTGRDKRQFTEIFFGSAFPTDNTQIEFVYMAEVRGFLAVARGSGQQEEIKQVLASRGVNQLSVGDERDDVSELFRLRVTGLAKEMASRVSAKGIANPEHSRYLGNDVRYLQFAKPANWPIQAFVPAEGRSGSQHGFDFYRPWIESLPSDCLCTAIRKN